MSQEELNNAFFIKIYVQHTFDNQTYQDIVTYRENYGFSFGKRFSLFDSISYSPQLNIYYEDIRFGSTQSLKKNAVSLDLILINISCFI